MVRPSNLTEPVRLSGIGRRDRPRCSGRGSPCLSRSRAATRVGKDCSSSNPSNRSRRLSDFQYRPRTARRLPTGVPAAVMRTSQSCTPCAAGPAACGCGGSQPQQSSRPPRRRARSTAQRAPSPALSLRPPPAAADASLAAGRRPSARSARRAMNRVMDRSCADVVDATEVEAVHVVGAGVGVQARRIELKAAKDVLGGALALFVGDRDAETVVDGIGEAPQRGGIEVTGGGLFDQVRHGLRQLAGRGDGLESVEDLLRAVLGIQGAAYRGRRDAPYLGRVPFPAVGQMVEDGGQARRGDAGGGARPDLAAPPGARSRRTVAGSAGRNRPGVTDEGTAALISAFPQKEVTCGLWDELGRAGTRPLETPDI